MAVIKTVNIKANIPVKNVQPPIYGVHTKIKMNLGNILKCLCRGAIVDEVLSDGSTVRLNTNNFRYDFEADLQTRLAREAAKNPVVQESTSTVVETQAIQEETVEEEISTEPEVTEEESSEEEEEETEDEEEETVEETTNATNQTANNVIRRKKKRRR
jgi:hypothetical protein